MTRNDKAVSAVIARACNNEAPLFDLISHLFKYYASTSQACVFHKDEPRDPYLLYGLPVKALHGLCINQ